MPQSKIAAILIETARPEALAEFYHKGLGLPVPQATGADHIGFDIGGVYLGFEQVKADAAGPKGPISIWFYVEDIEAVFDRFLEIGAVTIEEPTPQENGETLATLRDPDGNVIGLIQKKA